MKLHTVKEVLQKELTAVREQKDMFKKDRRTYSKYFTQLNQAVREIESLEKQLQGHTGQDIWDGEVMLVSVEDIIDCVNIHGYDLYGEMYRANNNSVVSPVKYIKECRQRHLFDNFTGSMIAYGLEVIIDLFDDNEADGYNLPNGHFDTNK